MKNKTNRLFQKLILGALLGAFFGTCAALTIDLFVTSFLRSHGSAVIGSSIVLLAVAAAACPGWMLGLYGMGSDVVTLHRETPETVLARLRHVISHAEGGLKARIDACVEMRELLVASAPDLLNDHPNLVEWIAANERYLRQLAKSMPREGDTSRNAH